MTNKERYHALEDFANFVANELFDVEWDYNCTESFPELACRKLLKLGIIDEDGKTYFLRRKKEEHNANKINKSQL